MLVAAMVAATKGWCRMGETNGEVKVADLKAEALKAAQTAAEVENKKRSGVGLRLAVNQTRGRNPQIVTYEAFDKDKPDTLPKTWAEFQAITGIDSEKEMLEIGIDGFNSKAYALASDPVAEYYEPDWSPDVRAGFKTSVKGLTSTGVLSLEQAVTAVKAALQAVAK